MKYIYCASTYPIFIGLYLKSKGENIKFLYSRKKYENLFKLLEIEAFYIDNPPYKELIIRPQSIRSRIANFNRMLGSNDLVFTHTQFSTFLFVLISNRPKNSKSLLYRVEPTTRNSYDAFTILKNFKRYLKINLLKCAIKFHYGTKTKLSYYSKVFFLSINEKYIKEGKVIEENLDKPYEILQAEAIKNMQLNSTRNDVLYIGQNESTMKDIVYTRESIEKLYGYIENNKINVKPHPSGYPYPNVRNLISPDIPTEFLFSNINKAIISISSTSLISASHYYKKHNINCVKIICLMNLVDYLDKESEMEMLHRIQSRALDNIYYPSSYKELSDLLFND